MGDGRAYERFDGSLSRQFDSDGIAGRQRLWRGSPYTEPVAPGFRRVPDYSGVSSESITGTTSGVDCPPGFSYPPGSSRSSQTDLPGTAGSGNQVAMKQVIDGMRPLVEASVNPHSGLPANELIGGCSAMASGGCGARLLESISRRHFPGMAAQSARTWLGPAANGTRLVQGHLGNFIKGAAAVAVADFLADRLDNKFRFESHRGVMPYISSFAPWVGMSCGGGWIRKAAVTAGVDIFGSLFENVFTVDKNAPWSPLLRPTGLDAIALGIGSALPLRNKSLPARLSLMGCALALSRGEELAGHLIFGDAGSARDSAWNALTADRLERSAASMQQAIDRLKRMDDFVVRGNVAQPMTLLDYYLGDQLSSQPAGTLTAERTTALYLTAAGQARLGKGTMVPCGQGGTDTGWWLSTAIRQSLRAVLNSLTGRDRQFDYILAGANLDLGGQALAFLNAARLETMRARKHTADMLSGNADITLEGKNLSGQEIKDLDKQWDGIDADLEKVYGKHDIVSIFKTLCACLNQNVAAHLRSSIIARLKKPDCRDRRYLPKLKRDLALVDLALGAAAVGFNGITHGVDGYQGNKMLTEAQGALQDARCLDDTNEDLGQLQAISKKLSGVAAAGQAQSKINNPFGITGWR